MQRNSGRFVDVIRPLLNGVRQGIIIRGTNESNPVLLHIHGGPGEPEGYAFIGQGLGPLEDDFTICYAEQRGSGLSYSPDIDPATMTLDQLVDDVAAVARHLCDRFGQEQIYVVGHSWGTLLASFAIRRHPELFHAYLGIGVVAKQIISEELTLGYLIGEALQRRDEATLAELRTLSLPSPQDPVDLWLDYLAVHRSVSARYGGSLHSANVREVFTAAMQHCDEYPAEVQQNWASGLGMRFSMTHLWPTVIQADLIADLTEFEVPVYLFQGVHDCQTAYSVAERYYESLTAPRKGFFRFAESAHFPHLEQPEAFRALVRREVLATRS